MRLRIIFLGLTLCARMAQAEIVAEVTPELDFASAYGAILDRSLRIAKEQWLVESADLRRKNKQNVFLPTVTAYVGRTDDRVAYTPLEVSTSTGLALSENIFRAGADMAGLEGAKDDLKKEQVTLVNERLGTEQDAVEALILMIQRSKEREVVEKIMSIKSEAYDVAKQRYKRGLLPILEVEKSGIELDNSRARRNNSEAALSTAKSNLTTLLGHARVKVDWPWKKMLSELPNSEHLHFAIEKRPDYQAAQFTLWAEDARIRQTRRQIFPSLDLSFGYNDINFDRSNIRDYETTATLTLTLFNQMQDYTNYRQQLATRGQAEVALEQVKRLALAQVENYRRQFQVLVDSARGLDHTLNITRRITDDSLERFRNGRATVNDLAIDQSRLLDSEILDADGWGAVHIAYARLCHSLGENLSANGTCGEAIAR